MCIKNTTEEYGLVAKGFHWLIGLSILVLVPVGFFMESMEASPDKYWLYGLHKSTGILVLLFAIARIVWTLTNPKPNHLESHEKWEQILSKITHYLLYFIIVAFPLSGWVMSSAGGHPVNIYGLVDVPAIVAENKKIGGIAHEVHEILGYVTMVAVALHYVGAIKHYFIDKDVTLQRMTASNLSFLIATIIAGILGVLVASPYVILLMQSIS